MFELLLMNKMYKMTIKIKDNREYKILKVKNYQEYFMKLA